MTKKRKTSGWWIGGTRGLDTNLIVITMFLIVFGLIMIYSASYYKCSMSEAFGYDSMHFLKNQALMSVAGLVTMYGVSCINYRFWKKKPIVILALALSVILTLILLIPALSITANGATRWVKFGPISFQVAEPVKIAVIVSTAWLINKYGVQEIKWKKFRFKHWVITGAIALPGVLLALFLGKISNNMSSALIIAIIGVMMYFAWHPKSALFYGGALLVGVLAVWYLSHLLNMDPEQLKLLAEEDFRIRRIIAWMNPYQYASDTSYQSLQALYAIGSGGLFGKGLGNSIQKLGSIPEPYNDFIFAIVCEELGVMGASLLMLMYIYLLYRIFKIAQNAGDLFGRMLASGVFCHIGLQVVMNIAVVTGVMPNTGVTLPFISYGGTAVVFLLIEIGMVLNVGKLNQLEREEKQRMKKFR